MKILVTGATGFIGNYVIAELLKTGNSVLATSGNIDKAKKYSWFYDVEYIECDLNEHKSDWYQFFQQPDLMIHLAWEGLPNYNGLFHCERNLHTTYQLLKNMIEHGLTDLTVIGTCLEYGMKSGELLEEMPTDPKTSYGLAKDTLRKFLQQLQEHYDFNLKWLRLFYMYGIGQNPNSILSQIDQALANGKNVFNMSGGEQLRDYCPVETVAKNILKAAFQNKVTGVINCCSGEPVSIRALVETYLKRKDQKIELNLGYYPYPDYEPMAFWGSNLKFKKIN